MEGVGKHLDELAEVHTLVCDIVEDGLVAVALIFHVTNLHLQSEVLGYLTTLNHRGVFAVLSLVILVHVHRLGDAIDALDVVSRLEVGLLHLQLYESACERNHSDIVARTCLHSYDVALTEVQVVDVMIISLARILELHLHEVRVLLITRHIIQIVVGIELLVLPAAGAMAESAVSIAGYLELHVLKVLHILYMCIWV